MPGLTIIGSGSHAPGPPVSNDALARVMDTSDEWIVQRTGIRQRHYAPEGIGASDIALPAAQRAIESAGLAPADIDYIIFATMTPDYVFPGPGGMLGAKLGIPGVPALDIRQQCAAVPFALQVADGLVTALTLLDPRALIIGGGLAEAGETLFTPLREAVRRRVTFQKLPSLVPAALGDTAGCLGAGLLAWDLIDTTDPSYPSYPSEVTT